MEGNAASDSQKKFLEWTQKNGIIKDKIEWPHVFENGLVGVRATQDIEYREALCYIPFKNLITTHMVQQVPELNEIIQKEKDKFDDQNDEKDQCILILYLFYEY